ncbi:50S ribosomal protein L11 methyltransferase [Paracoccus jeotgali]|uniref:Ribosomal protein L11 methyltransferase n=1 Tax=Paracoccus jeotgali TaxID=2065379 RepID=A0A2K9MD38_9RHOB|nr:50S ribosomal protein L11 methyltransferase [Paracoccus jeotgali]AUM73559.1 50S ribosomal protein L11 methyltransferase [Paracoccus jeotgali]
MATWTALTHVAGREAAETLSDLCEGLTPEPVGTGIFEIEDGRDRWEVGAYFTEEPDEISLALLAAAQGANPFVISELPDVDWVAHVKRELSPVEAGRFFVHGSHDADRVPAHAEGLLIEAAMAFGTGHHDTTRGCLLALDRLAESGWVPHRVADIGAGTAVLAMAAARLWPVVVLASDIDPVAVDVASANVLANGLDGRVVSIQAVGFDHPMLDEAAPFDLVLANILKQPLIELAPDMASHIAPEGRAILSGLLVSQADEVIEAYRAAGFVLESREDLGEWTALVMQRC